MPYVANDPTASRLPAKGPGRNPIWTSCEAMEAQGENYFELMDLNSKKYTISGLALHLGLSYWGLNEYQQKPGFSTIVQKLKSKILNQGENALFDKDTVNGAKFHLSVLGMNEKTIIETQNINLNANADVNLEALSDADLERLIELRAKLALPRSNPSGDRQTEAEQDQNTLPGPGSAEAGTLPEANGIFCSGEG